MLKHPADASLLWSLLMFQRSFVTRAWVLAAIAMMPAGQGAFAESPVAALEHFEKQVRPLLVKHCYECHSRNARRLEAGLLLDSRAGILRGGDSGPAVIPRQPDKSLLIEAIRYQSFEMPPRGKLSDEDIRILSDWVEDGAVWPEEAASTADPAQLFDWRQRKESHWSWQPISDVAVPSVDRPEWCENEVDRFILSELEEHHLPPSAPADRATWLRRVYFDLLGLPPAPEEVRSFIDDQRPDARARLVDKLLSSPHFGEKWARHWMDLVRYAETHGHEFDYPIHDAWKYRDWLVRAINADLPYDQFVREQIAGDLLTSPRRHPETGINESVIGTGFWFLGEAVHAPTNVRADLSIRIENQIDVFSRAFLGLSVACARCHDHKFDAITKEDYYALYGILNSSHRGTAWLDPGKRIASTVRQLEQALAAQNSTLARQFADFAGDPGRVRRELGDAVELLATPDSPTRSDSDLSPVRMEKIAAIPGPDSQHRQQWMKALADPLLRDHSHPLSSLQALIGPPPHSLSEQRNRWLEEWKSRKKMAEESRRGATCLEAFEQPAWRSDWTMTGTAFAVDQGSGLIVDWFRQPVEAVDPHLIHSGTRSGMLRGALRSPVFVLDKPRLHYRARGQGVMVRLVIENYFMDVFQPLLFRDATKKEINTEGEWKWITHAGDLQNHLGRRAYLEFLDDGDGSIEVSEIWLSEGAAPIDSPSELARRIVTDTGNASRDAVVESVSSRLVEAASAAARGEVTGESAKLANWLLRHQLLPGSEQTEQAALRIRKLAEKIPAPVTVLAIAEGTGIDEPVHIRGSDENFGAVVPRRNLLAISGTDQPAITAGSGRRELAERIVCRENPFLSRVMVNRLWHHLFGRGIVASVDDFGVMGIPPTHPELLDWLAADFERNHYSVKHTIRKIVLSRTYAQASEAAAPEVEERDPENLWLHRMSVRRLPAESLRDGILAVSGQLDRHMSGPSIPVHLTPFMQGRGKPSQSGPLDGDRRRSLYLEVRRNFLNPFLLTFDTPSPFSCMGRRASSNVPAQALILMNDPFVLEQATKWAEQVLNAETDLQARLDLISLQGFGRMPTQPERESVRRFLAQQSELDQASENDQQVWRDICHMLFNMKEFRFLR